MWTKVLSKDEWMKLLLSMPRRGVVDYVVGNQSGAVAREAYCGLWEPFDGAVPWWGARGATAGGSHLGGLEMGNEA